MAKKEAEEKARVLAELAAKKEAEEKARAFAELAAKKEAEEKAREIARITEERMVEERARALAEYAKKHEAEIKAAELAELPTVKENKEKARELAGNLEMMEAYREQPVEEQHDAENPVNREILCLEKKAAEDPENIELQVKLSDLYLANNMKQKAAGNLLFLADNLFESKLYRYSLKYYLQVVAIDSYCLTARIKIAQIYIHEDMDREAKFEFLNIAELYLEQNNLGKAEEFAREAIEYKSLEAHYILGVVNYKQGLLSEAAEEMKTLLKIKPKHLKALHYLFYIHTVTRDYIHALSLYERILTIESMPVKPSDDCPKESFAKEGMKFLMNEADSLAQKNLITEAMYLVQIILEKIPASIEAKLKMASLKEAKGLIREAAESYRKVSGLYLGQGNTTEAEKYRKISDQLDPSGDKTNDASQKWNKHLPDYL